MDGEGGALREDWDSQLQELKLSQDDLGAVHEVVSWAKTVSLVDLLFAEVGHSHLDGVSWSGIWQLFILEIFNVEDLAGEVEW